MLPGLWRLRLPLPWPGVPHCNAWAIAAGSGVVLVDTGMHEPGSLAQLERALDQVNLRLEHVRLLACTHAHSDHWGQAAPIRDRAGCEFWMHPQSPARRRRRRRPRPALARRLEVGTPERRARRPRSARYAERAKEMPVGDRTGRSSPTASWSPGVEIETDLGIWTVHETPGHAPSHVCLFQAERRLLISGDHLLGRISLFFDYGYTPDPVGEFLDSLDRVDRLDARLALSGHGKPFVDVRGHIEANRQLVRERAAGHAGGARRRARVRRSRSRPRVYGEPLGLHNGNWLLTADALLPAAPGAPGRVRRETDGGAERWMAARG